MTFASVNGSCTYSTKIIKCSAWFSAKHKEWTVKSDSWDNDSHEAVLLVNQKHTSLILEWMTLMNLLVNQKPLPWPVKSDFWAVDSYEPHLYSESSHTEWPVKSYSWANDSHDSPISESKMYSVTTEVWFWANDSFELILYSESNHTEQLMQSDSWVNDSHQLVLLVNHKHLRISRSSF